MGIYIIAYDISDSKRLQKIHRKLIKTAFPIAYSVFFFEGSQRELDQCLSKIKQIINPTQDDVRCYPLPQRGLKIRIGKATLPVGIICTSLPTTLIMI